MDEIKTVYIGYKAYPFERGWEVVKVFKDEEAAQAWMQTENARVAQVFDSYGLIEGEEYNYFAKELE